MKLSLSDRSDTMGLFGTRLGRQGIHFPGAATFVTKDRYYSGPSNKPFLRASKKAVLLEASLGELLTPLVLGS